MRIRVLTVAFVFALVSGLGVMAFPAKGFCQQPQAQTYEGTPYLSGGIGTNGRSALEQAAKGYNLKVIMAMKTGDFVADAEVTVANPAGKTVLQAKAQGPWLYAKLPAGTYKVMAQLNGKQLQQTVKVSSRTQSRVRFYW